MNKVGLTYVGLFNDYIGYLTIDIGSLALERRILFKVGHRGRIFWGHLSGFKL